MPYIFFSVVSCSAELSDVTNGKPWLSNNLDFGSVINSACDEGYELTSGNLTRTCQANGKWSGSQPVCTSK